MQRSSLVAVTVLAILIGAGVGADPARVPGTRVSIDPPPGFVAAQQFPGFQNAETQSSIMVTELPGPASGMRRGLTREALASRGMALMASSTVDVGGPDALLLHVRQASPAGEVLKWMLVGGDETRTIMIVGTYPAALATLGDAIRASLLTARLGASPTAPDPFEGLDFRVTPTRALKVAGRVGNILTLTESGSMTPADPDAALYFVGRSIGHVDIRNLREFSTTRLGQTTRTRDIRNVTGRSITLGGLQAYELEADAVDAGTGRAVHIYQVIAPDADGYFIVQGLVSPPRAPAMVAAFKEITSTFETTGNR